MRYRDPNIAALFFTVTPKRKTSLRLLITFTLGSRACIVKNPWQYDHYKVVYGAIFPTKNRRFYVFFIECSFFLQDFYPLLAALCIIIGIGRGSPVCIFLIK